VTEAVAALVGQALLLALWLALPALVAALAAGILTGVLGAITQVQDASVALVIRLAAVAASLVVFAPFLARQLMTFAGEVMAMVGRVGGAT
jgi:type III secretory pathway component EscS